MSTMSTKVTKTRSDKRDQIVKVSLQLFSKNGYDSTTIRMIAREAGISLGLLYNYFNGKTEVLRVIYDKSVTDMMRSFMIPAGFDRPDDKFRYMVDQIFKAVHKNLLFYKLFYSIRTQPSVQKLLADQFADLNNYILNNLEAILVELGVENHKTEAQVLHALIDGVSNQYVLNHRSYPLDEVQKTVLSRYLAEKSRSF